MASALRNLLDELSWEGRSTSYRGGGRGKENVLTAEVFQVLDALPRPVFFDAVLARAHRVGFDDGLRQNAGARPLCLTPFACEVLCGDRMSEVGHVRVQPDVLLRGPNGVVIVEAKRVRGGVFQPEQIARNLLVLEELRAGRAGTLLLVLGSAPPVRVRGSGVMSVEEAARTGLDALRGRDDRVPTLEALDVSIDWITWHEISQGVQAASMEFSNSDPEVVDAVRRLAAQLIEAVAFHS